MEAGADIGEEGLVGEPRGESGGRRGGEGVGIPGGEVRLVLGQRRRPVVVGKVMPSSSSPSSATCGLVGFQVVACRWRNVPTWLVLAPQVEGGHRLVVRGLKGR